MCATAAAIGGTLVWMGNVGWPGLHRDAAVHSTPILNINNGRGYTISVYHHAPLIYPGQEFAYHGQLYHFVLGRVLRCSTYAELLRTLGWLNAATVGAGILCFYLHLRGTLQLPWGLASLAACAGAAATAAVLLSLQGRPEHIIPLIGALAGLIRWRVKSFAGRFVVSGIEIGLVGLASPMPGVILAGAYGVAILVTPSIRRPIVAIVGLGAIALATWVVLMQVVFPFSLQDWLSTSAHQGGHGFGPRGLSMVPTVWIINSHHPLMIVTPAVLGGAFLVALWGLRTTPIRFAVAGAALLAELALWLVRGGFMYYAINYNLTGLFVQLWLLSFWLLREESHGTQEPGAWRVSRSAVVALAMIVACAGCALGFIRQAILTQTYVESGTTFTAADDMVKPLVPRLNPGERIAFIDSSHPSLVTLFDVDPDLLWIQRPTTELCALEEWLKVRIRFLIVPQSYQNADSAALRIGPFDLIADNFRQGGVTFAGVSLARFPPGYQFAVYERAR